MKKILPFLTSLLLVGCSSFDEVSVIDESTPVLASASTEEMTTKATLIETATTLTEVFPTMTIASKSTSVDVATSELTKGNCITGMYWGNSAQTFVSYPKGVINPKVEDNKMTFEYVPSTSMDDIVVAIDKKNNAPLHFTYRHIFCTVTVVYESMITAHKITDLYITGEVAGACEVTSSEIKWFPSTTGEGHIYRYDACDAYYKNQELTAEKFMFVPLSKPKVYVTIDGKQISHTVTCNPKAGDKITVCINDDFTFTDIDEANVNGKQSFKKESNGTYTMTINPSITGSIHNKTVTLPTNTVMVLDCSGSMDDNFYIAPSAYHTQFFKNYNRGFDSLDPNKEYIARVGWTAVTREVKYANNKWKYYNETLRGWHTITDSPYRIAVYEKSKYLDMTKMEVMKDVCIDYINSMSALNGENYISIVKYPSNGDTDDKAAIVYNSINASKDKQLLINAINDLVANGATPADDGMTKAYSLMKDKDRYYNSVIFVTDGDPNHGSGFSSSVANAAINTSNKCKSDYNAVVYSIGVFEEDQISDNCDKFLDRVSSNYKDATKYTNGTKTASTYYTIATSIEAFDITLSQITKTIQESITNLPVDGTAELRFVFSGLFNVDPFKVAVSVPQGCSYRWDDNTLILTGFNYQTLKEASFSVTGLTLSDPNFKGTACSFLSGSGLWYKGACVEEFHGTDFTI